ncbi:hypothetical protein S1OALGB6SA_1512 [Olavius algarvensis spirochete endosymbiont]|uniref:hypothetical protein n=1 Tax=Olavius algarvensis spirochete endosymbiont TaxID=260710 RepID=UPI000F2AC8CB|nr:hypothetical protein [Olavius algarvensis spirochete endosymbiont]VDB00430.1 hypothetical protein S1OALGB6SA_1512 [Olavius algarvensis spirochete endosymbiont]
MMTEETKKKVILLIEIITPFVALLMYPLVLLSRGNNYLYEFVFKFWILFLCSALMYFGQFFALLTRRENKFLSNVYVKIVVSFIYFISFLVFARLFYSFRERNIAIPSWWDWGVNIGGLLSLFLGGYLAKIKGGNRKWLNSIEAFIAGIVPSLAALLFSPICSEGIVLFWQFFGVG